MGSFCRAGLVCLPYDFLYNKKCQKNPTLQSQYHAIIVKRDFILAK